MMRSLFSGVSGLKTHQTKMDVIGNNIANVNTTSYKSASITFSDIMYQTTQSASGANATTGRAGINARQIGLGVQSAAISNSVTTAGATQTTGNPFDIKINGNAFFVVSDGTQNYFTRDGSFYVDGQGNLAMSSNGFNVMGWQVDNTTGTIKKDTVSALRIMSEANMTYPPEATTEAYVAGILDKNEPDASTESGKTIALAFFDALGYSYTAKFSVKSTPTEGKYTVALSDIVDSNGDSVIDSMNLTSLEDLVSFGTAATTDADEQLYTVLDNVTVKQNASGDYVYKTTCDVKEMIDYTASAAATPAVKRITGTTFVLDNNTAVSSSKDEITIRSVGQVSRAEMESKANKFNYVEAENKYYWDDDGDGVADAEVDDAAWQQAFGLPASAFAGGASPITVADDGTVSIDIVQTFKAKADAANWEYDATTFKFESGELVPGTDDATILEKCYGLVSTPTTTYTLVETMPDMNGGARGRIQRTDSYEGYELVFNTNTGKIDYIGSRDNTAITLDFKTSATNKSGTTIPLERFQDINIDWTNVTWFNNGGTSTVSGSPGLEAADGDRPAGYGKGRKNGEMNGVSIQNNGMIYASYDNGMNKLLGQIAVAEFANASGLEKVGDNLYSATLNSGEFDGIGVDISANGGTMATGALEMSNVDLSAEFTSMITTQRGFQANSRIITVSDTLLEELVNLKR